MNDEELTDEPWPDDPHQSPHPDSEEWNDAVWRAYWLKGLTDEELKNMSVRQKGDTLPAYVWAYGYETYGESALNYIIGTRLLRDAKVTLTAHQEKYLKQQIGRTARMWLMQGKTIEDFLNNND